MVFHQSFVTKGPVDVHCLCRTLLLTYDIAAELAYILRNAVWSMDCVNHHFVQTIVHYSYTLTVAQIACVEWINVCRGIDYCKLKNGIGVCFHHKDLCFSFAFFSCYYHLFSCAFTVITKAATVGESQIAAPISTCYVMRRNLKFLLQHFFNLSFTRLFERKADWTHPPSTSKATRLVENYRKATRGPAAIIVCFYVLETSRQLRPFEECLKLCRRLRTYWFLISSLCSRLFCNMRPWTCIFGW